MFDPAPSTWTGGLRRSPAQANLPILSFEDLCELFTPQCSRRSSVNLDMDSYSPTTPVSATSPTMSEQSLTPVTPNTLSYGLEWDASRQSVNRSLLPLSKTSASVSDKSRRSTVDHTQASFHNSAPVGTWSGQRTQTLCVARTRMSLPELNVKLSEQQVCHRHRVDLDRDAMMSSPKDIAQRDMEKSRQESTRMNRRRIEIVDDDLYEAELTFTFAALGSPQTKSYSSSQSSTTTNQTEPVALPERQPYRRSSRFSCRGRSQDRATTKPESASSSQTRSRIGKTSFSRVPRLEIHMPDPRKRQIKNTIHHLGIPLVPLISVTTGLAHPDFPRSILQYHLLTHAQLDSLARWYHQSVDNTCERYMYPAAINRPWTWQDARSQSQTSKDVALSTKRRRFGRFIGLRGCESPVGVEADVDIEEDAEQNGGLTEQMEKEWRDALRRAEEEERTQEKLWRGRW